VVYHWSLYLGEMSVLVHFIYINHFFSMFKLKVSNAGIVVNDAVLQNKVLKEVKNKSDLLAELFRLFYFV